ncbi:phosphoglycerate kinase [Rhodosalinus sp.]|uniref:phosphoglycerate kinase n=1 Tax=Rhodosalinus sp. TaxID=2047741 RepID=UPI003567AA76
MSWKTLDDMALDGRRVLVRVDINVPVQDGRVTDPTRIERVAPTVRDILARGGRPVLLAHFDRPKGRRVPEMSLAPLKPALEAAFGVPVRVAPDPVGPGAEAAAEALPAGEVLLLENTRFEPGEEANDPDLARGFARLGDVYCNDAFSAAHRAHASTEGVAHLLPACAGRLMEAELGALERALGDPERPVIAVVGGAKVSTKLTLLCNLVERVDMLVIGGGMANTFLYAAGFDVGRSLAERDMAATARDVAARAAETGCEILLPRDVVVAEALEPGAAHETCRMEDCPEDRMILDAGPDSIAHIRQALERARTLIWNGPLGAFEVPPFDAATTACARHAAELTRDGRLVSVAGGGDTVSALNHAGVAEDFSYVSTAGGAFLEWMEGKTLPGVAALRAAA